MPKTGFVEGGFSSGGGSGGAGAQTGGGFLRTGATAVGNLAITNMTYSIGGTLIAEGGTLPAFGSAVWFNANSVMTVPFWVPDDVVVKLLWVQNGATASGNTNMGIYEESASDLNLLVSSGAAAQAGTTAIQTFDIADTTLVAGRWYQLGITHSDAVGTFRRFAANIAALTMAGCLQQTGGLLNPLSANPCTAAYIPLMGLTTNASF